MSQGAFWIVALLVIVGIPQVLGFGLSRLSRNVGTRTWLGPVSAALLFGLGWTLSMAKPWRHLEYGRDTCGAAGALLIVGLFVFVPANLMLGGAIQAAARRWESRR
jgi:hypothetical protein